jgi:hypothetical protein
MLFLKDICKAKNIAFDAMNCRIRCIAHIMNLVVQQILSSLKADVTQNENEILDTMDELSRDIIPKVRNES